MVDFNYLGGIMPAYERSLGIWDFVCRLNLNLLLVVLFRLILFFFNETMISYILILYLARLSAPIEAAHRMS